MIILSVKNGLKSSLLIIVFLLLGFSNLKASNPIELHLDKTVYNPGETVHIKGYIIDKTLRNEQDFKLILIGSSIDTILLDLKLKSSQLKAGVFFKLPELLTSGAYQIRLFDNSYTQIYNTHSFIVLNLEEEQQTQTQNSQGLKARLNIFVEGGGDLVAGTENTILIKYTDEENSESEKIAFIKDDSDNVLGQFSIRKSGLTKATITPQIGINYKVSIEVDDAILSSKQLPNSKESGIRMSVTHSNQKNFEFDLLFIKKVSSQYRFQISKKRNIVTDIKISDDHFIKEFKSNNLPEGILQFSVLDGTGNIVKSRLVFNQKPERFQLEASAEKEVYKPGETIKLTIKSVSANGFLLPANLSISVSDLNQVKDLITFKQNVWTSYFSEVDEFVSDPQNYFDNSLSEQWILDELMITLSTSISKIKDNKIYSSRSLAGINISGEIITSGNAIAKSKDIKSTGVVLSIPGTDNPLKYSSIDNNNRFSFDILDFDDSREAYLKVWPSNLGNTYQISIDENRPPVFDFNFPMNQLKNETINHLTKYQRITQRVKKQYLNETSVVETSGSSRSEFSTSLIDADKVINLDDYVSFKDMRTVVKEVLPYVQIKKYGFKIFSTELRRTFPNKAFVLLDGIPVEDSVIIKQDPIIFQRVEIVNTLRTIYQIGKLAENGIVAFYTRPGHGIEDHNSRKIKVQGYYYKEYDKDNNIIEQQANGVPYTPALLFWDNNFVTDDDGSSTIEFRAPDYETNLTIHLEGMSSNDLYSVSEKIIKISH